MPRTSHEQYITMVQYMEEKGDLSKVLQGPGSREKNIEEWKKLAVQLNDIETGDLKRSEKDWRRVWTDYKNNIKRKWTKMRINAVGRGKHANTPLTSLEYRVLHVMDIDSDLSLDTPQRDKSAKLKANSAANLETQSNIKLPILLSDSDSILDLDCEDPISLNEMFINTDGKEIPNEDALVEDTVLHAEKKVPGRLNNLQTVTSVNDGTTYEIKEDQSQIPAAISRKRNSDNDPLSEIKRAKKSLSNNGVGVLGKSASGNILNDLNAHSIEFTATPIKFDEDVILNSAPPSYDEYSSSDADPSILLSLGLGRAKVTTGSQTDITQNSDLIMGKEFENFSAKTNQENNTAKETCVVNNNPEITDSMPSETSRNGCQVETKDQGVSTDEMGTEIFEHNAREYEKQRTDLLFEIQRQNLLQRQSETQLQAHQLRFIGDAFDKFMTCMNYALTILKNLTQRNGSDQ